VETVVKSSLELRVTQPAIKLKYLGGTDDRSFQISSKVAEFCATRGIEMTLLGGTCGSSEKELSTL
jgi:hypothetical protein